MAKIIPFNKKSPPFTLEEAAAIVREMSKESSKVLFLSGHAKGQAKKRKATSMQIFDVLKNGKGISGPKLDNRGNWRIKMKHYTCGRIVQVVIAFLEESLIVVTVI